MSRNELELRLIVLAAAWGAKYIPIPDEDWEDAPDVQCSGAGCGEMGEPNYYDGKYFCGGSPQCCP